MNNDVPCRVMADLARHEADLRDSEPTRFDEYEDDHIRAIVPYELVKPIQELLHCRRTIQMTDRSFGTDPSKALEMIKPDLDALYRACVDRWNDL